MPIYKGSTKIGAIKKGSTKIGKVYKGSTLVYSSGTKTLPIYQLGTYVYFGITGYAFSLDYPIPNSKINTFSAQEITSILFTLKSINGTLGTSGSSITVSEVSAGLSFRQTVTRAGLPFYHYVTGDNVYQLLVSPKQKIGDKIIPTGADNCTVSSDGKTVTLPYISGTITVPITSPISVAANIYYRS